MHSNSLSNKPLIYVVDDEKDITRMICHELSQYDFEVESFATGHALKQALEKRTPQLCLIDLGLPDMDGMNLIKPLSEQPNIGLVIISGRNSLPDRVLGLEFGADDFISKPFDPRELVARVKSVIRRLQPEAPAHQIETEELPAKIAFAHWIFDQATLTLTSTLTSTLSEDTSETEELSAAEAEILNIFLSKPKQILARERFMKEHTDPFDRSIDVRISRLRKKIEIDHKQPKIIKTVYGAGYIFTATINTQG